MDDIDFTEPKHDKYVVFKSDDVLSDSDGYYCSGEPVPDAVVIRSQDLLAAPMFGLYRDMLTLIINAHGKAVDVAALQRLADKFDGFAAEATDTGFKLPD